MGLLLLLGVVGWCGLFLAVDRASIPAHRQRDAYRYLAFGLLCLLAFTTHKALAYRQELRFQIQVCR